MACQIKLSNQFSVNSSIPVHCPLTGSSANHVLHLMRRAGERILDLSTETVKIVAQAKEIFETARRSSRSLSNPEKARIMSLAFLLTQNETVDTSLSIPLGIAFTAGIENLPSESEKTPSFMNITPQRR